MTTIAEIFWVILWSMAPVSELRGGIPWAYYVGLNPWLAFLIPVVANILVIPILFFFLDKVHKLFYKIKIYKKLFDAYVHKTRKRAKPKLEKYGYAALTLFVAIPFPATGAYTGTIICWLFGLERKKAYPYIVAGVIIAGIIVSIVMLTGTTAWDFLIKNHFINKTG